MNWRNATDPCCKKRRPGDYGWLDCYLMPTDFVWNLTPLQVDVILRAKNDDYNDDNLSENDCNVNNTSDESDAE